MTAPDTHTNSDHIKQQRWELLEHINRLTETPLIALSFVWLGLLVIDLTSGLGPLLQVVSTIIWLLFILDFSIEFIIAPHKGSYLRRNWLTVVSLLLPALRMLRIFRALRVLQAARATRSVTLIRLLTSLNRGMRAVGKTLGRHGIGYVIAITVIITFAGATRVGSDLACTPSTYANRSCRGAVAPFYERPLACALFTNDSGLLGKLIQSKIMQQSQQVAGSGEWMALLRELGLVHTDVDSEVQGYAFSAIWTGFVLVDRLLPETHRVAL